MEQSPQNNEHEPPARPKLEVDLTTWDGHWFNLINAARQRLEGDARKEFNQVIWEATQVGSGVTYNGLLGIINAYMDVTDTSGTFAAYAPKLPDAEIPQRGDVLPQGPQNDPNQTGEVQ
jgi:hypothetical protein